VGLGQNQILLVELAALVAAVDLKINLVALVQQIKDMQVAQVIPILQLILMQVAAVALGN
jgi:hypothetical protein